MAEQEQVYPMSDAPIPRLWTIEDLAARWELTTGTAWAIVRNQKVPYICLNGKPANLNGRGPRPIKFREDSILKWELEREGVWVEPVAETMAAQSGPAKPKKATQEEEEIFGWKLPPKPGR